MTTYERRGAVGALTLLLVFTLFGGTVARGAALTGEVLAVDPEGTSLWLRCPDGADQVVRLQPGAEVLRDGRLVKLDSLRPVADGFCQEARVWLTDGGWAVRVEAAYPGREGRVEAISAEALTVTWTDGRTEVLPLAARCRVKCGNAWEEPGVSLLGKWVYVLCDLTGRVKNIAVSE